MSDEPNEPPKRQLRAVPLEDVRRARGEAKVAMPRSKVASLRAFRRVRADRTFGAIGIILLLIGVALIFAWEKPPPVEKKFGVEWPQSTTFAAPIQGQALTEQGPTSRTHTYTMSAPNATAITFSLLWTDAVGDQGIEYDTLELDVKGPAGVNVTNATISIGGEKNGNITIPLGLNGIPDLAAVSADTEAKALRAVGDRTNRTGIGDWTITVRLVSAPGDVKNEAIRGEQGEAQFCNPQIPDNMNCTPDGRQEYTLQISYVTYGLKLKKLF